MEFFKQKTPIDFMGQRNRCFWFSGLVFSVCIMAIAINGLNLGLDFVGGTQIQLHYPKAVQLQPIRDQLHAHHFKDTQVQFYGTAQDVLVRLPVHAHQDALKSSLSQALPDATVQRMAYIGPQIGNTLLMDGILAIVVSLMATMAYIAIRFEYRFAISAIISLIHDPIVILGVFALCHIPFDLIALAALLTILGYSLNDTIVVYDRVRENFRKGSHTCPTAVMNLSVNQTLSRTIMTSGLTLMVVLALLFFGGPTLMGFSMALSIGIVVGTYSSIYIAGSLAVWMGFNQQSLMPTPKTPTEYRP